MQIAPLFWPENSQSPTCCKVSTPLKMTCSLLQEQSAIMDFLMQFAHTLWMMHRVGIAVYRSTYTQSHRRCTAGLFSSFEASHLLLILHCVITSVGTFGIEALDEAHDCDLEVCGPYTPYRTPCHRHACCRCDKLSHSHYRRAPHCKHQRSDWSGNTCRTQSTFCKMDMTPTFEMHKQAEPDSTCTPHCTYGPLGCCSLRLVGLIAHKCYESVSPSLGPHIFVMML